jgi:hypothetical protein
VWSSFFLMNLTATASVRFRRGAVKSEADALLLCGVMSHDGGPAPRLDNAGLISYRDLDAIVRTTTFTRPEPDHVSLAAYRVVVQAAFETRAVVPAPFGTVFRNRDALMRWLELHYFTLADALRFVHDRQAARVRITPGKTAGWDTREMRVRVADLEVTAFDSFRVLRRESVAFVPVEVEGRRTEAEGAFLVERERWTAFSTLVKEEQKRLPDLRIEQTGPWPAYDFVRLELTG